ncbi:hypothetical protein ACLOJK_015690 [Asimina triloba]
MVEVERMKEEGRKEERRRAHSALGSMPKEWTSCHESGATKLNQFPTPKVEKFLRGSQGSNNEEDVFGAVADGVDAEAREGKERGDFELAGVIGVDVWISVDVWIGYRDLIDVHHSFLWINLVDAKILPFEKGQGVVVWGKLAKVFEDESLRGDVLADEVSLGRHKEEDLVEGNIRNDEEGAFKRREEALSGFLDGEGELAKKNDMARGGGVVSSWVDRNIDSLIGLWIAKIRNEKEYVNSKTKRDLDLISKDTRGRLVKSELCPKHVPTARDKRYVSGVRAAAAIPSLRSPPPS